MTKITEKQLIESLKQLKEIKPTTEWASLLKSQILVEEKVQPMVIAEKASFMDIMYSAFAPRKLAYALSAVMVLMIGVFGYVELVPQKLIPKQTASLTQTRVLSQEVALLNSKISDLAIASKTGTTESSAPAVIEIKTKVSELAKNLKDNPVQDSQTIKDIATSLKTLADVPGTDIASNSDVKDLYQAVVQSQITDLKNTTLTKEKEKILSQVEELYKKGDYSQALEKILLISR
jgi:hypothetical protein